MFKEQQCRQYKLSFGVSCSFNSEIMKTSKFRKVEFTMKHMRGYGHYMIESFYKKRQVKVVTTDSFIWDYLDDEEFKQLQKDARKACYMLIVCQYEKDRLCK